MNASRARTVRPPRLVVAAAAAVLGFGALAPAPAGGADPAKVIRDVFPVAETGFDPAGVHDLYSGTVVQAIHETLYTYDYLARPSKVVPLTAEALPEVADGGRTWTIRLRKGIHFAADPAFKGRKRELVAEDFVYAFKRFMDPKNRSPWAFMIEGKIEGAGDVRIAGRFKGDVNVQGNVTIEQGAHVNGQVNAATVIVSGEVEGNINASARVELLETGVINGDVKAAVLTVAAGSRMRGQADFGWTDQVPGKK